MIFLLLSCGIMVLGLSGCEDEPDSAPKKVGGAFTGDGIKKSPEDGKVEDWVERQRAMDPEGEGFLVWTSNRNGPFRVWRCELDGTNHRAISPEEEGVSHVAPHISPDGKLVAFASGPEEGRYVLSPAYSLRVMNAEGGEMRELVPRICLALGGCRVAVWTSPEELIYIDHKYRAVKLHIHSGESEVLTDGGRYLVNRQLTHALDRYFYHRYDQEKKEVIRSGIRYGGCGPYFSDCGRWGVRMNGAGGPLSRIDLDTGEAVNLLEYGDPRMPENRNYIYFPMMSRCSRLLTFSASRNTHCPVTSDYDIFVVRTDPKTLTLLDDPVRYTFDPKTDRYPDVFLAEPPLGRHVVEAPATVQFPGAENGNEASWDFGGGEAVGAGEALYAEPGTYEITREFGSEVLQGEVTVEKRTPPEPVSVKLRGGKVLEVIFNEEVDCGAAEAVLESGVPLKRVDAKGSRRVVEFELGGDFTSSEDVLTLSGVVDLAQKPNPMKPVKLTVRRPAWPASLDSAVFVWEASKGAKQAEESACDVTPTGRAQFDRHGAMVLRGGSFVADVDSSKRAHELVSTRLLLTIEAMILPASTEYEELQPVFSFRSADGMENFVLGQQKDRLIIRMQDGPEKYREFDLCQVNPGKPHHFAMTWGEHSAACYVNGEKQFETAGVAANFRSWPDAQLVFGSGTIEQQGWAGKLDGLAVYARILGQEEILANYSSASKRWAENASDNIESAEVEVELVQMSKMPTLKEIAPYREGLVLGEFKVNRVVDGEIEGVEEGGAIRVAVWAIQDKEVLPISGAKAGDKFSMRIEPFDNEKQPQLSAFYKSETLPFSPALPMFDTGEFGSAEPIH